MSRLPGLIFKPYGVIAVGTLFYQFYMRWQQCSGLGDCILSSAKAVVWSVIWPVYWPLYLWGL